jgi:hypothetical protein
MDRLLYAVGGLTALLGALVLGDNIRNLRPADETPIVAAWVGGWLIIGLGALVRAVKNKA